MITISDESEEEAVSEAMELSPAIVNTTTNKTEERSQPKRKRKSYSLAFRKDVLNYLRTEANGNKHKTSRHFGVTRTTIRFWLENEVKLDKTIQDKGFLSRNRRTLPKKRVPKFEKVEEKVLQYMKDLRSKKITVSGEDLKTEALRLYNQEFPTVELRRQNPFNASSGWLGRFQNRNNIRSRSVTTVGQKIPENAEELALKFFRYVDELRQKFNSNFVVWNADQMPVYFDSPQNTTLDFIGNETISVRTSGHEKTRFTIMLCADNTGRKLKPTIIFKGLKKVPAKKIGNDLLQKVHVMTAPNGTINSDLMKEWREKVFAFRPGHISSLFAKPGERAPEGREYESVLVLDSALPHKNQQFMKDMKDLNGVKVVIIPGGMTPLLQPADISWNREVKRKFKECWREWMEVQVNTGEKIKRPGYKQVVEWCLNGWQELDRQIIIDSFKYANLSMDYNEDAIHSKLSDLIKNSNEKESETEEVLQTDLSDPKYWTDTLDFEDPTPESIQPRNTAVLDNSDMSSE